MINGCVKGKDGEREFAHVMMAHGYIARRGQQHKGGSDSPDVVCPGLEWLHIEVKRDEKLNVFDAVDQSVRDGGAAKVPVVAHRKNNRQWLVSMNVETFFFFLRCAAFFKRGQS